MTYVEVSLNIVNTKYGMQTLSTTVYFAKHIRLDIYKMFQIRLIYHSSNFVLKCMRKISPLDPSS